MDRIFLFTLILFAPQTLFAQQAFTVGTASAAPGQKATGYLEVLAGVDAATKIPVVVVNGAKPGKRSRSFPVRMARNMFRSSPSKNSSPRSIRRKSLER